MDIEKAKEQFNEAWRQMDGLPYVLELYGTDLLVIISQLQLALRHPGNNGPTAIRAKQIAESWIDEVESLAPGVKNIMELGWNPDFDEF